MTDTAHHDSTPRSTPISRSARLAWLLDNRFQVPGTSMRIGLDGLVGLIPGIGDTITSALSLLILAEAIQLRVRKRTLAAIAANIALDWVVGLVPVVGDVFDIVYKANTRNVVLLEAELAARRHGGDVAMHERPSKRVKNVAQRRGFATN